MVDLLNNGMIFPTWIMKNFKDSVLPEIIHKEGEDPCAIKSVKELRKYQEFVGKYLDPNNGNFNELLLYHGLGAGKTITAINLINILYNYSENINVIILLKASLRDDPWLKDMKEWLEKDVNKVVHFVNYDSPYADKDFLNLKGKLETTFRTVYIIEEAHNFIRNVYSNITTQEGHRAQVIYDYIIKDKTIDPKTVILAISGTPIINTPFELALLFNMLRPNIFPKSEVEFNEIYLSKSNFPTLRQDRKNMFQRRILGLVSYYIGATPDLFAKQEIRNVKLEMSNHQYDIYKYFEEIEEELANKAKRFKNISNNLYKTYTRQTCNFVFPNKGDMSGVNRPKPKDFKIMDTDMENIDKGRQDRVVQNDIKYKTNVELYLKKIEEYVNEFTKYINSFDKTELNKDLEEFKKIKDFRKFYESNYKKSKMFIEMYMYSPKMTAITFNSYISPGLVLIYSNYVRMEGLEIMKIYLGLINLKYCEFHGMISKETRLENKDIFNSSENFKGSIMKAFLFSPSGSEGINLFNVRQIHVLEPHWNEAKIRQVIGRGVRQCSHQQLEIRERVVEIYRYFCVKPHDKLDEDPIKLTTDEIIDDIAKSKENLNISFLSAIEEASVDCNLFKNHNMMNKSYNCFQFPEQELLKNEPMPAYREDIKNDLEISSGLNDENSYVENIKVIEIKAVISKDDKIEDAIKCLYDAQSGMIYDFKLHYPIGRVMYDDKGIVQRLDKETYIMKEIIKI